MDNQQLTNTNIMNELKVYHKPGSLYMDGRMYVDQLSEEFKYLPRGNGMKGILKYIKSKYGLSYQEYYSLVVYGDKDYRPKCPTCGGPINKVGDRFYGGYKSYCSKECQYKNAGVYFSEFNKKVQEMNPEERRQITKAARAKLSKICSDESSHKWRLQRSAAMLKGQYLSRGLPEDPCHFYIATEGSAFKYGVTVDPDHRVRRMNYDRIKVVVSSTRKFVTELEYRIKLDLIDIAGNAEEFIKWETVPKFIQLFGKHYNKLISDQDYLS